MLCTLEHTGGRSWLTNRLCLLFIALAAITGFQAFHVTSALASTNYIKGHCYIHRGRIVIPYLHRYHVKIHGCKGSELIKGRSKTSSSLFGNSGSMLATTSLVNWWDPFDLRKWDWGHIVDLNTKLAITVGACGTFAGALLGEIPSGGFSTFILIGSGGGCIAGIKALSSTTANVMFHTNR